MTIEDDLEALANEIDGLRGRFVRSSDEQFLRTEDQAMFKRRAIEAKALLEQTLGFANDFSFNLANAVNAGSGGFIGGPSLRNIADAISTCLFGHERNYLRLHK